MVATNSVAPRTANVSAGTSIFAMVVLERALATRHHELDLVTTPAGDLVAMVHCNNGASELAAWADVFGELAAALGSPAAPDDVFGALFRRPSRARPTAAGCSRTTTLGRAHHGARRGRPLFVRTPDSRLTLANFMRAQVYGVFGTLALGMRVLAGEGVALDAMFAHGGIFRTEGWPNGCSLRRSAHP
ncbi:FGGY-family carbohydrate kinase [Oerskovia sp. M15]